MAFIKVNDFYYLTVLCMIRLGKLLRWSRLRRMQINLIGWFAYSFSFTKSRKSREGLVAAFGPELAEKECKSILRSSFRSFWSDSFAVLPLDQQINCLDDTVLVGEELLRSVLARQRGVILLESNSFGERLLAKQILAKKGFSIYQVHAENHLNGLRNVGIRTSWFRESILKATFERWEKKFVAEIVHLPEDDSLVFTRTLQRLLEQNRIICSAGDGRMGQKLVSLPFLGRERPFATGMFSLSAMSGAPILPLFCYQDKEKQTKLVLGPEKTVAKRSVKEALELYVGQLEDYARRHPEQYRNWHF